MLNYPFSQNHFAGHSNGQILFWIMVGLVAFVAFAYLTQFLWNRYLADAFHGPRLNIKQVLIIMILVRVLFGAGNYDHSTRRNHSDQGGNKSANK